MIIFMRRFGDDVLNGFYCWMDYGMAAMVMYQVVTAITDWCRYVFKIFVVCSKLDRS